MDLQYAILGLLSWKPLSGYDLKRIISDSEVFYWSGNNNQIYKGLIALEKDRLVTHRVQVQESLPAKKIYSITGRGLDALRSRLLSEPELPEVRKGFLIQLAWSETLSDEEVLGLLERYEEEIDGQLRMRLAQADQPGSRPGRSPREEYLWERIHANLIAAYRAELDWARQTQMDIRDRTYLVEKET